jgi:Alpha/beta hydrolase family
MRTVTSRDGTKISLDILGAGPPVIFVGGALADRSAGAPLATALARNFTVLNYDRRGRGDSGDTPPYAVEREVEDIAALIPEAGGAAFLLGGSSGAVLALDAAASGLAVTRLALYEPPFIVDDSAPPVPGDMAQALTTLVAAGRRGDAVEHYMTRALGVSAGVIATMRDSPYWAQWEAIAHTLAYDFTIMADTVSGRPLGGDHGAHTGHGRWREPCADAQRCAGPGRSAPHRGAPHPARADLRRRCRGAHRRADRVLLRLSAPRPSGRESRVSAGRAGTGRAVVAGPGRAQVGRGAGAVAAGRHIVERGLISVHRRISLAGRELCWLMAGGGLRELQEPFLQRGRPA